MFVRSFVRSFVLPSVARILLQSFALKFLKWCISQQLLIRKHSYLDHSYPGGWHSLHDHGPQGPCHGVGLEVKFLDTFKSVFSKFCYGFLEVYILGTTYHKAFILRPKVPSRVIFHSMTSDPRVYARGWG